MKGIENITGRILREADAEAAEIRSRTKQQVQELTAEYDARCAEVLREAEDAARARAAEVLSRTDGTAVLEHRKALLQEKQDLIDRAFTAAGETLRAKPAAEQVAMLSKLAAATARGGESQILNESDRAAFGADLVAAANVLAGEKRPLTLAAETRPMLGGFVLKDGAVEQNCSFEVLLRSHREAMALEVSKLLFD